MNSLKLIPDINELYKLNDFVHEELSVNDMQIDLVLEEIFVNIVNYSNTEFIIVNVDYDKSTKSALIEFVDNGIEFNPLLKDKTEFPNSIEESEIGGLGIFFIKNFADDLKYNFINGENHLKIIKNFD